MVSNKTNGIVCDTLFKHYKYFEKRSASMNRHVVHDMSNYAPTCSVVTHCAVTHSDVTHCAVTHCDATYCAVTHSDVTHCAVTHCDATYCAVK